MRLIRVTYKEQNGTMHTHIVLTNEQLTKVLAQARRLNCSTIVEKLLAKSCIVKL